MQRHVCNPRPGWQERVERIGLTYHSHDNGPYWDESACYELTAQEVDILEAAANDLHFRCIDAAEAFRVQRRYTNGAGRSGGGAVVLVAGHAPGGGSIQFHPRAPHRGMGA